MKYVIFFVSLCLVSCSIPRMYTDKYSILERNNSLYLISRNTGNQVRIADGEMAIRFFKKNVRPLDGSLVENVYFYYLKNSLDSANSIFHIQQEVGGVNWIW